MARLAGNNIWLVVLISLTLVLIPAALVLAKWLDSGDYYGSSVNLGFPSFKAVDAKGDSYDQSAFAPQLNLAFFGNTRCASICAPRVNLFKRIKVQLDQMGEDPNAVKFIFFTLDPEFDQPQRLYDYFQAHDERFAALAVRDDSFFMRLNARLGFVSKPLTQGQFQHSDYIYLIEPNANVRLSYSGSELDAKRIADDIVKLLDLNRETLAARGTQ